MGRFYYSGLKEEVVMTQSNIIREIFNSRQDISDYVFHFTKRQNAKETLKSILKDNAIKDIRGNGYMCFSEAPITMLPSMFKIFKQYTNPLYAPYGIGIKKDAFYKKGGKPVIYGDLKDRQLIPNELKWRFEYYNPDSYDFSWLREWRILTSKYELNFNDSFVIIDTRKDYTEMQPFFLKLDDIDIDSQPEDGGILTEYTAYFTRMKKVVIMEDINELNSMSKQKLKEFLKYQDDQYSCPLGATWE